MYARYGIPIAFLSTGDQRDYHQLTDEVEYIDYSKMARVAGFIGEVARQVADLDHRVVVDKPKPDPAGVCRQ
jgi:CO dehydrogenase/acetyl-CoA synthase alpha subunit